MRFIKENPALAVGIGLPIMLVILFSLAAAISQWTVAPPQYDLLFTMENYSSVSNSSVAFDVSNGHVRAQYKNKPTQPYGNNTQHLYRFNSKTQTVHEINFNMPSNPDSEQWSEFMIPDIASLQIDSNQKAPDGYEFSNNYAHGSEVGWPFFAPGYYGGMQAAIANHGRVIAIPQASGDNRYYSPYSIKFLGWIVSGSVAP